MTSDYDNVLNSKARYYRLKAEGKCVCCGKENDRENRVQCSVCAKKDSERVTSDRKFYEEQGLCNICGKYKVPKDYKRCPECNAKKLKWQNENRSKMRDKINHKQSVVRKFQRIQYEQEHRCTLCGKQLREDYTYKRCEMCRNKQATVKRNIQARKPYKKSKLEIWREEGKCVRCGGERYENYKLCKKCYDESYAYITCEKMQEYRKGVKFNYGRCFKANQ